MESSHNQHATPQFPSEALTIFLIGEELKSRKFFNTLQELGLDNSYYQPNLDDAIRACVGLTDESNAALDFYYTVMEEHAGRVTIEEESSGREAREVYTKLVDKAKK